MYLVSQGLEICKGISKPLALRASISSSNPPGFGQNTSEGDSWTGTVAQPDPIASRRRELNLPIPCEGSGSPSSNKVNERWFPRRTNATMYSIEIKRFKRFLR